MLLVGIAATWIYFNQDKVINWFVNSVNEQLATPVQAKTIELTFLDDFPNISIVCKDVRVEDSFEAKNDLLTAQSISFQLNLSDLWRGNYRIKGLTIKQANGNFIVDKQGRNNYTIFKETNSNTSSAFSLENIVLKSIETWSRLKNLRLNRSYSILLFSPFAQIFELDLIIMAKKAYSIKFSEDLALVNLEKINPRRSRVMIG